MIDIKLDYFTLLSPEPILINGVGSVKSPTLRDISKLNNGLRSYDVYQTYLSALLTNINAYYEIIEKYGDMYFSNYSEDEKQIILKIKKEYENLSDEDKTKISMFNILIFDKQLVKTVCEALNFFMLDKVIFSDEHMVFLTYNNLSDDKPTGYIDQNIYSDLINIILQRVNISNNNSEYENVKVKNKTTARLLEKMKKSNEKSKKKADKKMELPNIISSISSHHNSLNIINVWDLTVYQLYDQFNRQRLGDSFNIQSMSVAAWGDSDGKFDETVWFSLINDN